MFFLHLTGFGFEYLWPTWPEFDSELPNFAATFSMIFLLKFTVAFLPIKQAILPKKVFNVFFYIFCFSVLLNIFTFVNPLYRKIHIIVFFAVATIGYYLFSLFFAFKATLKGNRPALLYLIAFLFFFSANLIYALRTVVSMHGWVGEHILQLGNIVEVITLSIGLSYWIKSHYDERQKLFVKVTQQQAEQAEEKNRIARDLHDNIGTQLTTLSMALNNLAQNQKEVYSTKLNSLQEHATAALAELRNTLWVINKSEVTAHDVAEKIGQMVWRLNQYGQSSIIEFKEVNINQSKRLNPTQSINLFRILQEAITNSWKHSRAKNIFVIMECFDDTIKLIVKDNGVGFELHKTNHAADHYGLANMEKRALEIRARFSLWSENGKGTILTIEV